MSLTLVILAAGKGARFGGDKPLAAVGPRGQSLFEYSVYDAWEAGFNHVIFVVNAEQDCSAFSMRLERYGKNLKIEFVVQTLDAFVKSGTVDHFCDRRTKPWGTGHAVLACHAHIDNPFVVINADDYYGRGSFESIGNFLLENRLQPETCALPGYLLKNTLSLSGGVNRGICSVDSDGYLESILEVRNILPDLTVSIVDGLPDKQADKLSIIEGNSIVSMTFWGFHPSVFDLLEQKFQEFLENAADIVNDEYYLPAAVDAGIKSGILKAKVFPTTESWKGLTYAADSADVQQFISELTVFDGSE